MAQTDPHYKPVSEDPKKSCKNCKHFKPTEDEKGDCMGYQVSEKGICDFYEKKE